jgi:hypothetical protein
MRQALFPRRASMMERLKQQRRLRWPGATSGLEWLHKRKEAVQPVPMSTTAILWELQRNHPNQPQLP